MKVTTTVVTMVLAVVLTGCAGGVHNWKEQVILPDGRELIVERTNILGSSLDREFSSFNAPPPVKQYILSIPLPGGENATWEAGRKDMHPLAALVDEHTAYVVAEPFNCDAHTRLGRPIPPFFFFKFELGKWTQVKYQDLPWAITKANLLMGSGGQIAINLMEKGVVTAKIIKVENETTISDIYPDGANKYLWRDCLSVVGSDKKSSLSRGE